MNDPPEKNLPARSSEPATEAKQLADPNHVEIAFIFAMPQEAAGLVDKVRVTSWLKGAGYTEHLGDWHGRRVAIAISGPGRTDAARVADDLIRVRQPRWVISAGFAGGLDPRIKHGEILMVDRVRTLSGEELEVGLKVDPASLEKMPGVHLGKLITVDGIVGRGEDKHKLGAQYAAQAVDMETHAVASICVKHKVPLLAFRVISDAVDEELPPYLNQLIHEKKLSTRIGVATRAIFKKFSSIKEMWNLKSDAIRLSDHLAKFLEGVIRQLK